MKFLEKVSKHVPKQILKGTAKKNPNKVNFEEIPKMKPQEICEEIPEGIDKIMTKGNLKKFSKRFPKKLLDEI